VEHLMKAIREQARRDCAHDVSPAGPKIIPIPAKLRSSTTMMQLHSDYDDTGHYARRVDFERLYKQSRDDLTVHDMLLLPKRTAKFDAQLISFANEKDKKEFIDRHGNVTAIIGNPGMGKTTLAKQLVVQFLDGQILPNNTILFFIFIQRIDFQKTMSLLEFLLSKILPDVNPSKEFNDYLLQKIAEDRDAVIVMDGLDEMCVDDFTFPAPAVNLHDHAKPIHFLLNLISGKLLPYARIIVTSRSKQFYQLHVEHRPRFVFEVLGLDEADRDQLAYQICPDKYNQIKEIIQTNSKLSSYCYVPINFILTLHYLMETVQDTDFVSITKVILSVCSNYLQGQHMRGETLELTRLSELAWNGFFRKKVTFGRHDFVEVGLDYRTLRSFLTPAYEFGGLAPALLSGDKRFHFAHLLWQEFFVAVYLMVVASEDNFRKYLKYIWHERWEFVTVCLFGLCNHSVVRYLLRTTSFHYAPSQWREKKDLLQKVVASYLHQQCNQLTTNIKDETTVEKALDLKTIRSVCSWIHEANDREVIENLVPLIAHRISFSDTILPSDVSNLFFVLQSFPKPWTIEVYNCDFLGNAMERFCLEARRINALVGIHFCSMIKSDSFIWLKYGNLISNKVKCFCITFCTVRFESISNKL